MAQTIQKVTITLQTQLSALLGLGIGSADPAVAFALGAQLQNANGQLPAMSLVWQGSIALVSSALTLDLTALASAGAYPNVNANGLALRHLFIQSLAANTLGSVLVAKPGGTNGYTGWAGSGGWEFGPGDQNASIWSALGPIGSTAKTIDFTSTGDATAGANILMIFG